MAQQHVILMPPRCYHVIQAEPDDSETVLAILDAAAQWLVDRGIDQWQPGTFAHAPLDCMAGNPGLRAYYERAGFHYRGKTQDQGWCAALYEKRL